MVPALELHTIAQYSVLRIVSSLAEGSVVCIFAALLLRLRRQSASARFAIAFASLIAIALMPLASALWPHHPLSVSRPAVVLPESLAMYVFWTWAVLAACFLLSIGRALWHLHQLRKSCTPVAPAMVNVPVQDLTRGKGLSVISLCTSNKVRVPTAIGLTKPAIILPDWALHELSPAELDQVVLHELTHLRRWDDWTTLGQKIVKAFFFFHPAVWWIEKKLSFEREMACDDAVLAETSNPRAYAECLAHLAERSFIRRSVALAQAALGHVSQVSKRVAQILEGRHPSVGSRAWKMAVSLVAGFAMVCAVGIAESPTLIAFSPSPSAPAAVASPRSGSMRTAGVKLAAVREPVMAPKKAVLATLRKPVQPRLETRQRLSARGSADSSRLVHLTRMEESAPVTQTLLVFISTGETNSPDQQVYQVQVWRFTVLKTTVDPTRHTAPRKET